MPRKVARSAQSSALPAPRVMQATVGMDGNLQGIAGKTLQEIEGLEMKALESQ